MNEKRKVMSAFRMNAEEARMLDDLRKREDRSRSDMIRQLIKRAHFKAKYYDRTSMAGGT